MIGVGTCGAAAYAIYQAFQDGQLNMIQDAKRWRAMRWGVSNSESTDERIVQIIETAPDLAEAAVDDVPTPEQMNAIADQLVAHLEANGVDLSS
jgi:hypothetical protein